MQRSSSELEQPRCLGSEIVLFSPPQLLLPRGTPSTITTTAPTNDASGGLGHSGAAACMPRARPIRYRFAAGNTGALRTRGESQSARACVLHWIAHLCHLHWRSALVLPIFPRVVRPVRGSRSRQKQNYTSRYSYGRHHPSPQRHRSVWPPFKPPFVGFSISFEIQRFHRRGIDCGSLNHPSKRSLRRTCLTTWSGRHPFRGVAHDSEPPSLSSGAGRRGLYYCSLTLDARWF